MNKKMEWGGGGGELPVSDCIINFMNKHHKAV